MKVELVQVSRERTGEVTVHLLVTRYNHAPEAITVNMPEVFALVRNFAGWLQDQDGNWHRPFRLGNKDNWEPFIDPNVKWARRPATDEELLAVAQQHLLDFRNAEIVDHCNQTGIHEYVDAEAQVRIVPKSSVHIDPDTGSVQIEIEAFDSATGEPLWVDDGFWSFQNFDPMLSGVFDPATKFRKVLAMRVREEQERRS